MRLTAYIALLVSFIGVLVGCAALPKSIPMSEHDRAALATSRIVLVTQETPGFMFTTPAKALVDAEMARWKEPGKAPSWARLTEVHGVPDFTDAVRQAFAKEVRDGSEALTFSQSDSAEPWDDSAEYSRLSSKYDHDYVLEFRTNSGMLGYGPLNWKKYHMNYFGEAVLIRMRDLEPVWKATCSARASDENPLVLPGDDFLVGDGKLLQAAAKYATQTCAAQLAEAFAGSAG